jgi:hypothetical protein
MKADGLCGAVRAGGTVRLGCYPGRGLAGREAGKERGPLGGWASAWRARSVSHAQSSAGEATTTSSAADLGNRWARAERWPSTRRTRPGRPPATLTPIDRDYQHLRADMNALFAHLALTTQTPLAA